MTQEETLEPNFELGPYIVAALFCERVLEEKDGVRSAIRIIDRVTRSAVGPQPPEKMEPFSYEMDFLLSLKTGENPGTYRLTVHPRKPSNIVMEHATYSIHLEPPAYRGYSLRARMHMRFDEPGVWMFDVALNGKRITRIPFQVIYLPQELQT